MADLVQHPLVQALAWALLHFIWQGAAIALAAFLAFRLVRESASVRYAIGVGALTAMLAAPVATFVALVEAPAMPLAAAIEGEAASDPLSQYARAAATEAGSTAASLPALRISPGAMAVAVLAWLSGVTFFSLRLLGGWVVARRMARQSVRPAAAHIQALAARVAERLDVHRIVAVLESTAVVVPVMVGWLKPTIILPIAALAGLTPTQVEALLAHELAHIRRHDYLVNLLQSVTEAILFYHPAVWWLSRRVRVERELCCDDLAVGVCDRLVYATALTDLAAMTSPQVALAATDGDLLGRVRRILGHSENHVNTRGSIMSGLAFGLVATIAIPVALISAGQAPAAAPHQAQAASQAQAQRQAEIHAQAVHRQHAQAEENARAAQGHALQQAEQKRLEELRRALEQLQKQIEHRPIEELRRTLEQMHQQLPALELKQVEQRHALEQAKVEHSLATNAHAAQTAATQAELAASRRALEAARTQFERGLISRSQLLEAEAALAHLQTKGNADATLALEVQEAAKKVERSRALVEKGLLSQRDLASLEAQLANLEQRLLRSKVAQAEVASEARAARLQSNDADARARVLNELLQERRAAGKPVTVGEMVRELHPELPFEEDVTNPNEPTRAGDTLRVTIEGEPSLPQTYRVGAEGTIRIPFLGSIKVVGLTAAQARAAIGNQLSARKLGQPSQVKVTLTRPRVRVSRDIKIEVDPIKIKKVEPVTIKVEPVTIKREN